MPIIHKLLNDFAIRLKKAAARMKALFAAIGIVRHFTRYIQKLYGPGRTVDFHI